MHEYLPIMSEEYRSEEKPNMLSASKMCVLPENLCVHSGSSHIVINTENSQLLTSTYENQSINLQIIIRCEGMSYNIVYKNG